MIQSAIIKIRDLNGNTIYEDIRYETYHDLLTKILAIESSQDVTVEAIRIVNPYLGVILSWVTISYLEEEIRKVDQFNDQKTELPTIDEESKEVRDDPNYFRKCENTDIGSNCHIENGKTSAEMATSNSVGIDKPISDNSSDITVSRIIGAKDSHYYMKKGGRV